MFDAAFKLNGISLFFEGRLSCLVTQQLRSSCCSANRTSLKSQSKPKHHALCSNLRLPMILKGKRWLDLNWLPFEFKGLTERWSALLPFWSIDIRIDSSPPWKLSPPLPQSPLTEKMCSTPSCRPLLTATFFAASLIHWCSSPFSFFAPPTLWWSQQWWRRWWQCHYPRRQQFVARIISKLIFVSACKRKDVMEVAEQPSAPKKPRLVFTDLQRRTLQAIFKVPPTPSLGTSLVPWFCPPLGI